MGSGVCWARHAGVKQHQRLLAHPITWGHPTAVGHPSGWKRFLRVFCRYGLDHGGHGCNTGGQLAQDAATGNTANATATPLHTGNAVGPVFAQVHLTALQSIVLKVRCLGGLVHPSAFEFCQGVSGICHAYGLGYINFCGEVSGVAMGIAPCGVKTNDGGREYQPLAALGSKNTIKLVAIRCYFTGATALFTQYQYATAWPSLRGSEPAT